MCLTAGKYGVSFKIGVSQLIQWSLRRARSTQPVSLIHTAEWNFLDNNFVMIMKYTVYTVPVVGYIAV